MLKLELVKERFINFDENDLVVGELFFKELDERKYDQSSLSAIRSKPSVVSLSGSGSWRTY